MPLFTIKIENSSRDQFTLYKILQQQEEQGLLLSKIYQKLKKMETNQSRLDAAFAVLDSKVDELGTGFNGISADISELVQIVKNGGMQEDQEKLFVDHAEALATKVTTIADAFSSLKDVYKNASEQTPPPNGEELPNTPENPEQPENPQQPENPEQPSEPENPETPTEQPEQPIEPPTEPVEPEQPAEPENPEHSQDNREQP